MADGSSTTWPTPRRSRFTTCLAWLTTFVILELVYGVAAQAGSDIPHVDSCNYCTKCHINAPSVSLVKRSLLGQEPTLLRTSIKQRHSRYQSARSGSSRLLQDATVVSHPESETGVLGSILVPHGLNEELIGPNDLDTKHSKPNCTECYGCNVELQDIAGEAVKFENIVFNHGKGATNGWLFFARPAGSAKRYIVKVYCMPFSKAHGRPQDCNRGVYLERLKLMMAQVQLARECGVPELTPRVWVAPISAVVPNGTHEGYHVRWHGLWMEEAPGITLHGLMVAGAHRVMYELLQHKMNKTQVVLQSIMDLLTAQCDRHGENIFISADGSLKFIDNDRALGVVTRCGADSVLLPGTRYHTQLRINKPHGEGAGTCAAEVDPRILMDYRCFVPDGQIGTDLPQSMRTCMEALSAMSEEDIMDRYGFGETKAAAILKRRSSDILSHGFEYALQRGPPISSPKYRYKPQPPCCEMTIDHRQMIRCKQCWRPITKDMLDDSPLEDAVPHIK